MAVKEAMKKYFQMRKELADQGLGFLFKTPETDKDLLIYEGAADEEGYKKWKPVEMTVIPDVRSLEEEFAIHFHQSIVDYFSSYWFADLDGFINGHYIALESVLPNVEVHSFRELLKGYKKAHGNSLKNIPIGIEGNGLVVVVDNSTGKIQLEDYDWGTFEHLAESIEDVIENMKLKRKGFIE